MPTIRIDNTEVTVDEGDTILDAARKLGIDIPTLCYRDDCDPNTSCLVCVVRVNGSPRLVPSCATRAVNGMVVESETESVHAARRTALDLLLADHAGDCLAPCTNVCPAHMDIPTMIRQISAGDFRDALITVKETIALPAVLGRICPELCEKGCRRAALDQAISICRLKRFVADEDLASSQPYLPEKRPPTGKSIAIVGSGPTGLSAAWYLLRDGHDVTVFDQRPQPGGTLRYVVPERDLPRDVLDAEIDIIRRFGARFELGAQVGQGNLAIANLLARHAAILLAVGEIDKPTATSLGVDYLGKGIKVDKSTWMTSIPGVFAAGTALAPFPHYIRAVAEGREAAHVIDLYARGLHPAPEPGQWTVRLGVLAEYELAAFNAGAAPDPRADKAADNAGLPNPAAVREANRCLSCDCGKLDGCLLREYSVKYNASQSRLKTDRKPYERIVTQDSVIYESGKCIACGLCVQITQREGKDLALTHVGRGFQVKIGVPFDQPLSDALQGIAEKVVEACPTGALTLRKPPKQA